MNKTAYVVCGLAFAWCPLRAQSTAPSTHWVGTWAASQQIPEPQNSLSPSDLADATLRQTVHVSLPGGTIRIHLSNAFGTTNLHIDSVHVARPVAPGSSAILPATDKAMAFHGAADVLIPPGAEYVSDPVDFPLAALSDLTVSMHVAAMPGQETGHPGSRQTTYCVHGDKSTAPDLESAKKIEHWFMLSGVDVAAPTEAYAIVALGDSITDGHATTTNGNDRWTDVLAKRLQAGPATGMIGVLNQGIGGNHLLTDGLGPNALARFDRDVLAQTGVRYLIVLEAINDLGGLSRMPNATHEQHEALVSRLIGAYEQILARAHAHGIKVYGATVLPDGGSDYYHPDNAANADRAKLNAWIRMPGNFDEVIDLEDALADPKEPTRLLPAFDSGDHLHPGPAGYKAMGDAISLSLFR